MSKVIRGSKFNNFAMHRSLRDILKLLIKNNEIKVNLRNSFTSNQDGFQLIKNELKLRDDNIHKLRHKVLLLQETRDQIFAEVCFVYGLCLVTFFKLYKS